METVPGALWHGSWLHWRVSVSLHWGVVVLQTSKLHSSCQIRWQFVILLFNPFPSLPSPNPPPTVPNVFGVLENKNTDSRLHSHAHTYTHETEKKTKKQDASIAFHFCCICRSYTGTSAMTRAMNGPGRRSFMMTARGLNSSTPLLLQGFNSHRNQSLKRGHGAYLVERRESKQVNKSL